MEHAVSPGSLTCECVFSPGKKTLAGKKNTFPDLAEIAEFPENQLGATLGGGLLAGKIINSRRGRRFLIP